MPNEKMMILNMLQEGKITAEEASKLLSTVDEAAPTPPRPGAPSPPPPALPQSNNRGKAPAPPRPASGVDFDEIGRKFAAFAKDLEPKIQKATEIVAEKTVVIADKLSEGMKSVSLPRIPVSPSGPGVKPGEGTHRQIELTVIDGYNELNLSGLNGDVIIKGYNGDKISANIRYKANRHGASIDLMKLGGKYYLGYEEDDFQFVSIDAYVPTSMFKVINLSGLNGNMDISGLECDNLQISNTNGQLTVMNMKADSIKSESGNGRLTVGDISAATAVIEHFNGAVEAGGIDAANLSLTNFNGAISMSVAAFAAYSEYLWNIETSNAKLTLNVPTLPDLGYHIRANSALGNVRLGLTGLEFLINDPGQVEARTAAYDSRGTRVRLSLETSNAALTVN